MTADLPLSFYLGIPSLDADHIALLEKFRATENEIIIGNFVEAKRIMLSAYNDLIVHFDAEERIMYQVEYPGIADHIQTHSLILMLVESILSLRPDDDVQLVLTSLRLALRDHILRGDVPMAHFYHSTEEFKKCRFLPRTRKFKMK